MLSTLDSQHCGKTGQYRYATYLLIGLLSGLLAATVFSLPLLQAEKVSQKTPQKQGSPIVKFSAGSDPTHEFSLRDFFSRATLIAIEPLATITVTNTNDSGVGSLRQAISDAASGDTINFSLAAGSTITLTSAEMVVNKSLTIDGPGANLLTIQRSMAGGTPEFGIFHIISANLNVTISGLTISNGRANGGGGLENFSSGTVNIIGCTFSGNSAEVTGGAIDAVGLVNQGVSGTMNIINSTLSGNSSSYGGGIYLQSKTVNITNSTISGNSANNGGGINTQVSNLSLVNSTVADNSSPVGGGLIIYSSQVTSRNTIIAANSGSAGPDIFSPPGDSDNSLLSTGYNLIGNNSSALIVSQSTDQIGTASTPVNPMLAALSNYGGPTETHALFPGSPALDKGGAATGITTDQRGFIRPSDDGFIPNAFAGDGSDIGAFELQSTANSSPTPTPTPTPTSTPTPTVTPTPLPTATPTPSPETNTITYSYDSLNRLISVGYATGESIAYSYDAAGNRSFIQATGSVSTLATPTGPDIRIQGSGASVTFAFVSSLGTTTIVPINPGSASQLPFGYELSGNAIGYDIATTATIQGPIGACFNVIGVSDPAAFSQIRILHDENGRLVDRTGSFDFVSRTICSNVPNLGQFVLANTPTRQMQLQTSTYAVSENVGAVSVFISRLGDSMGAALISFSTDDFMAARCDAVPANASAKCDYTTVGGTVRFAAGEVNKAIVLSIVDDAFVEGNESLNLTLSEPSGAALGSPAATTITIVDNDTDANAPNPYLNNGFFVRQHYLDFLLREPDTAGYNDWQSVLNNCGPQQGGLGAPVGCDRVHVSSGFFRSTEFGEKGYWVYRFFEGSLGRRPTFAEFMPEVRRLSGLMTDAEQESRRADFIARFMQLPEFTSIYTGITDAAHASQFIAKLEEKARVTLPATAQTEPGQPTQYGRAQLINLMQTGSLTPAQTLRAFVEQKVVWDTYFYRAFVAMQYFGYLRRDPEAAGYDDWVDVLTNGRASAGIAPGDYRHLIFGFIYSEEYRERFGKK